MTGARLPAIARQGLRHLREPLFLHAYALAVSGLATSGLGVVYWALAARLYPAEVVGINAALLSLVTLLGNISQLNLRSGFSRFVPLAGDRVGRLIGAGYLAALGVATATSLAAVWVISSAPFLAPTIPITPLLALLFPATVIASTLFGLQDQVLTALRRTIWVPVENAAFALLKIGLLVLVAGSVGTYGILVSWTVPMTVLVVVVSSWIFRKAIRAYRPPGPGPGRRAGPGGRALDGRSLDGRSLDGRSVLSYVGVDYVASLFSIGASAILPVIVLSLLGAASSAHFYVVALVAAAAELLPSVLSASLLVEASANEATFERDGRRVLRQLVLLLVPIVVVLVVAAPLILGIFGAEYAREGAPALRLLALSGIPYALIQLAYIRLRLERRVGLVLACQATLAIANVGGCLLLLPQLGLVATGIVSLVSEGLVAAVLAWTQLRNVILPVRPAQA